jgi:hypothetical protein
VTPIYLIQIPIETTCDPGTLLDIAIELGAQAAAEATECANSSLETTVDEQEILVRPAGLTSLERELLAALTHIINARDHYAEHNEYPPHPLGPNNDQCFDDWAADLAERALDMAGGAK